MRFFLVNLKQFSAVYLCRCLGIFGSLYVFRLWIEPVNSLFCARLCVNLLFLVLQPWPFNILFLIFWSLGFSHSGLWIHVCPSIRLSVTAWQQKHIGFWWFYAQSYILIRLRNVPSRFLKKILVFSFVKKCHKNQIIKVFGQKSCFLTFFSKRHIRIYYNLVRNLGQLLWIIFW